MYAWQQPDFVRESLIMLMVQGNDIGEDRVMTFSDVRDEVCRLVMHRACL